jgi:hypothetical protein
MNTFDLVTEIESTIKKICPDSYLSVKFSNSLYPNITIVFAMGKDKTEWSNGIIHNDPCHTILSVDGMSKDGEFKDTLTTERILGGGVYDSEYGSHKIPFRKKTVKSEQYQKIIDVISDYFKKVKTTYNELYPESKKSKISMKLRKLAMMVE